MSMTDVLGQEHQVVLSKLQTLEGALGELDVSALEEVLSFMEGVLPLHRRKEEEVLFPVLGRHVGLEDGPVSVMLSEHETEKQYLVNLRRSVDALGAGADSGDAVRSAAWAILNLLRAHIDKEDNILFPMAERHLTPEERAEVTRGMGEIPTFDAETRP